MEEEYIAKIKMEIEQGSTDVINELKDSIKKYESKNAKPDTTAKDSGLGALLKGVGPAFEVLTKMGFALAFGVELLRVLKPVTSILNAGMKIIAEMLRPISMIMVVMLAPLLQLLKPILVIINAIFAPFKTAMLRISAQAQVDIAKGMATGDSALLAKGMAESLLAAGIGLIGFKTAMQQVVLEGVKLLINFWAQQTSTMIKFLSVGLATVVGLFSKEGAARIASAGAYLSGGIEASAANMNEFISVMSDKYIESQLQGITQVASAFGINLKDSFVLALDDVSVGDILKGFVDNQKMILSETAAGISNAFFGELTDGMKSAMETGNWAGLFDSTFNKFRDEMVAKVDETFKNLLTKSADVNQISQMDLNKAMFGGKISVNDYKTAASGGASFFSNDLNGQFSPIEKTNEKITEITDSLNTTFINLSKDFNQSSTELNLSVPKIKQNMSDITQAFKSFNDDASQINLKSAEFASKTTQAVTSMSSNIAQMWRTIQALQRARSA